MTISSVGHIVVLDPPFIRKHMKAIDHVDVCIYQGILKINKDIKIV